MSAQPIESPVPQRFPESIREFRGTLVGDDLVRFNAELEDLPLNEVSGYLKGWKHLLYLRTIPEIGEALRTAFDRPATPIEEIFPEWESISV